MSGTRLPDDLGARVAVAVPAAALTVALVLAGSAAFAAALALLGVFAALEAVRLVPAAGGASAAVVVAVPVLVGVAAAGGRGALVPALCAAIAATAILAARRSGPAAAVATTAAAVLVIAWLGLGLAHGVLLRDLPEGAGLVLAVLVGTLVGDTAAHLVGTAWGSRPLAAHISPAKTIEGVLAGLVVAVAAVWLFSLFHDWLGGWQALVIGCAVAVAAPAGDLFESLLKREAGVKDSGAAFGPHGGVLDRIDAVLVAAVAGYYAALAVM